MKKLFFALAMAVLFLSVIPAKAMETKTYYGVASSGSPYWLTFQTLRQGDVAVQVVWTPKPKQSYILQAYHFTDPTYPPYYTRDYNYNCTIATYQTGSPANGNWTFYIPAAPAGYYAVEFKPYNSPVSITVYVTAETNP